MDNNHIAAAAFEVNRQYCLSLNDHSHPRWENAPDWQKSTILDGVAAIQSGRVKSPAQAHENWLRQKQTEGWTYGPGKDPVKREHPCMVPFEELPVWQRVKDFLFFNTVTMLLNLDKPAQPEESIPAVPETPKPEPVQVSDIEVAEHAYLAYAQVTDNKNFRGDPMPVFADLPDVIKKAWCCAAVSARNFGGLTNEEAAGSYIEASGTTVHASDCATSVAPAEVPAPCDCQETTPVPYEATEAAQPTGNAPTPEGIAEHVANAASDGCVCDPCEAARAGATPETYSNEATAETPQPSEPPQEFHSEGVDVVMKDGVVDIQMDPEVPVNVHVKEHQHETGGDAKEPLDAS